MADKFDWDKFDDAPAASSGSSFDWDAFDDAGPVSEPDKIAPGESAVRGAAQGASAGFADEVTGFLEAAYNKTQGNPVEFTKLYEKFRDQSRSNYAKAKADNPGSYTTGELAGAVGTAAVPGLGGVNAAKLGLMGAAAGAGYSEAKDAQGLAMDTAIGAGTGILLGKGGEYAGKALSKAGDKVGKLAGEKARELAKSFSARAQGVERGTAKKIGQKKVLEIGAQGLDENLLSPLASTDDLISRNNAVKSAAMESRKKIYDKIDDAGASAFSPLEVATKVEEKIIGGKNMAYDDVQELAKALDPHLSNSLSRGDGQISMSEAQNLVEALGKKAKFDTSRSSLQNQVAKDVYHIVRDSINEAAEKSAKNIGDSGLREALETANKKFSTGKFTDVLLQNKQAKEQGNKLIGLTDSIVGGTVAGPAAAGLGAASALVVAKKGAERYGAQNAALALNKISQKLLQTPQGSALAKANPKAFQAAIQNIAARSGIVGESLQKIAGNEESEPLKGEAKWAADGFAKLSEHAKKSGSVIPKSTLLENPKAKRLLMSASDLPPGSKQMEKILLEIQKLESEGGK